MAAPNIEAAESVRRVELALHLASVLRRHGVTAAQAESMSVGVWRSTAAVARQDWRMEAPPSYVPSEATRAVTTAILRHHEAEAAWDRGEVVVRSGRAS
jgi:hypothetical protein